MSRALRRITAVLHGRGCRGSILAALAIVVGLSGPAQAAGPAPGAGPRVVSINLCTDQLLVALADPDQIAGLSPYATDRVRSILGNAAARFPILSGTAEEVLVIRPDLVLAGRFTKRATRDLLKAHGLRVVEFDAVGSVEDAKAQLRLVGTLVGHPERAEAAVATIEAAVARVRAARRERPLTVLPLQRRGWVSGRASLVGSLLDTVGLTHAGASLSARGRSVTLEEIVRLRPDLLLVSRADLRAEDQGSALLLHPALAALYPPDRRLTLPEQMTVCGGPEIGPALDRLAAEVARLP